MTTLVIQGDPFLDRIYGWTMSGGGPLNMIEAGLLGCDPDYRYVALTVLFSDAGNEVHISTVFLVDDGSRSDTFPPLFETMVFLDGTRALRGSDFVSAIFGYKQKCHTLDEAQRQHVEHVEILRQAGLRIALDTAPYPWPFLEPNRSSVESV